MRNQRGFTLLEVLVAALIMGIAVAGILNALTASARNTARLTQYDRAALLAREKMDQLLVDQTLPRRIFLNGNWTPTESGGVEAGWSARITPMETAMAAYRWTIDRVELEIWWMDGATRHTFSMEGFRRSILQPEDAAP